MNRETRWPWPWLSVSRSSPECPQRPSTLVKACQVDNRIFYYNTNGQIPLAVHILTGALGYNTVMRQRHWDCFLLIYCLVYFLSVLLICVNEWVAFSVMCMSRWIFCFDNHSSYSMNFRLDIWVRSVELLLRWKKYISMKCSFCSCLFWYMNLPLFSLKTFSE